MVYLSNLFECTHYVKYRLRSSFSPCAHRARAKTYASLRISVVCAPAQTQPPSRKKNGRLRCVSSQQLSVHVAILYFRNEVSVGWNWGKSWGEVGTSEPG